MCHYTAFDARGMAAFHAEKLQRGTGLLRVGHAELQMPKLMSEPQWLRIKTINLTVLDEESFFDRRPES